MEIAFNPAWVMLNFILYKFSWYMKHAECLILLTKYVCCWFQFSQKDKAACSNPGAGSILTPARKDKDLRQCSLKQKLSSVLCPDKMTLCRKRPNNAATLYQFLSDCFSKMPPATPSGECPFCNRTEYTCTQQQRK